MTSIKIHGLLGHEFGSSFSMDIDKGSDVFDAIEVNRTGFKRRIFELSMAGFDYCVVVDGKKFMDQSQTSRDQKVKTVELVPIISGRGAIFAAVAIATVVSTAISIMLMPDPPEPPEIQANAKSLEKSFVFAGVENRAAQGTPVPVCYGELLVGSEVIQTCLKTYPQNQETFKAFRRNALDSTATQTKSSSQLGK